MSDEAALVPIEEAYHPGGGRVFTLATLNQPSPMSRKFPSYCTSLSILLLATAAFAEDLPKTFLATRGKLLESEDFAQPLPPLTGKPIGFASGFQGWRYNPGPGTGKGGRWEIAEGAFKGIENPEAHHPATASYGLDFKDAIIQCEVRLDDVPDEGRKYRYVQVKATDTKDYVCAVALSAGQLTGRPYDDAKIDPVTKQRMAGAVSKVAVPVKVGEWHTIVLEIKGDEGVGTVDGKSVTFSDPLVGVDKHSVMFVAGTEGSFRHFRIWEALPNPDWAKNKEAILAASQPAAK